MIFILAKNKERDSKKGTHLIKYYNTEYRFYLYTSTLDNHGRMDVDIISNKTQARDNRISINEIFDGFYILEYKITVPSVGDDKVIPEIIRHVRNSKIDNILR